MSRPPEEHPERYEWMHKRAQMLAALTGLDWLPDEIERLWNNPDEYALGTLYDPTVADEEEMYALVKFCIGFGIEYEREYPTGGDWRDKFAEGHGGGR